MMAAQSDDTGQSSKGQKVPVFSQVKDQVFCQVIDRTTFGATVLVLEALYGSCMSTEAENQ